MTYEFAKNKGVIIVIPGIQTNAKTKDPRLDKHPNGGSNNKAKPNSNLTDQSRKWHVTRGQAK